MRMAGIPFGTTGGSAVEPASHKGEVGTATWRTRQFGDIRVRMVEYSPGYLADHWCEKGHILFCIEGELDTELAPRRARGSSSSTERRFAWQGHPIRRNASAGRVPRAGASRCRAGGRLH